MSECPERSRTTKPGPAGDLAKLRELGVLCSAEFIVQASRATASTMRSAETPQDTHSVGGRVIASRAGFFSPEDLEKALEELRHHLPQDSRFREGESLEHLVALWATVEPYLQPSEFQLYWPAIERRLSGGAESKVTPSRAGTRQGGGY
jgi:hypothetical protein